MTRLKFLLLTLILVGCSSKYNYHIIPTPIKIGETHYFIENLRVNLSTDGANSANNVSFATEQMLHDDFIKSLNFHLKELAVLANNVDESDVQLKIAINYLRKFSVGGVSLGKPSVSYAILASNKKERLASFKETGFTSSFDYFKEMTVNLKITLFEWGASDEQEDINAISKKIADDIYRLGRE